MNYINLRLSNPKVKEVVKACYPAWRGRKVRLADWIPTELDSYWSGGSRDFYVLYDMSTRKTIPVGSNHPLFERDALRTLNHLPVGVIIVRHTIFCGKSVGIVLHCNEVDRQQFTK